jgi:cytidine deaminase
MALPWSGPALPLGLSAPADDDNLYDRPNGKNHTTAAAARSDDGRIVTGLNVYHFTGGPCAELVVIGTAASLGIQRLETITAVGDGDVES